MGIVTDQEWDDYYASRRTVEPDHPYQPFAYDDSGVHQLLPLIGSYVERRDWTRPASRFDQGYHAALIDLAEHCVYHADSTMIPTAAAMFVRDRIAEARARVGFYAPREVPGS